jgi:hypothetical protein
VIGFSNRKQPIFSTLLFTVSLFAFNGTNENRTNRTTGKGRFIHWQKYVDWIAIVRNGLAQEAEVAGEHHPGGQHFFSANIPWSGSNANLLRLPLGVSTIT